MKDRIRKPEWLKISIGANERYTETKRIVESHCLHTICSSGRCPNMGECWGKGTATFMIGGDICTRCCKFCNTQTGKPLPLGSKLKAGKSAQKIIAQCKAIGYVEELAKPRPFELKAMMIDRAKAQGTSLPDGAAAALLERCGEDPFLLENEVDKLCALSGYQTVTAAMVADMGTVSLEADVFEMIRMITAKNATGACKKLQTLLRLQQEPIAITAAMIGSYVDLYRVKLGAARKKNYSTVFKDFGYKGSDYRLKRSAETASHYTLGQLEACLQVLLDLDRSLKSQPVDAEVLLEAALCRLALAGSGR